MDLLQDLAPLAHALDGLLHQRVFGRAGILALEVAQVLRQVRHGGGDAEQGLHLAGLGRIRHRAQGLAILAHDRQEGHLHGVAP